MRRNLFILISAALSAAYAGVRRWLTTVRLSRRELLTLLDEERELRIMQLAAVSTASIQNTVTSIKDRIGAEHEYCTAAYLDVCKAVDREMRERQIAESLHKESQHLRAQLMQLRVENSDPGNLGRVGWQVSAFIPQAVLDKIRHDKKDEFVTRIASALVDNALRGIFMRNAAGNCTALVWSPLGADSKKTVLEGWFEGDSKRPGIIYNSSDAPAIRRIIGAPGADADAVTDAHRKLFLTAPAREEEVQLQPSQEEIDARVDKMREREKARQEIAQKSPLKRG